MGHHAEDGRLDADLRERRDTEHHEAHVPDRGVRDQALQVLLSQGAERAVDHRYRGKGRQPHAVVARLLR